MQSSPDLCSITHFSYRHRRRGEAKKGPILLANPLTLIQAESESVRRYLNEFGYSATASAPDAPHNWSFQAWGRPEQTEPMPVPRGKVVGGTSAINGQVILRGLPEDFDSWADLGNDEWAFVKVLPYLRKLESDMDIRDDFLGSEVRSPSDVSTDGIGCPCRKRFTKLPWPPVTSKTRT